MREGATTLKKEKKATPGVNKWQGTGRSKKKMWAERRKVKYLNKNRTLSPCLKRGNVEKAKTSKKEETKSDQRHLQNNEKTNTIVPHIDKKSELKSINQFCN